MVSKKDNRFLLFLVISLSLSLSLSTSLPLSSNKNFKNLLLSYSLAWQHKADTHILCLKKFDFFCWSQALGLGLGSLGGGEVRGTLVSWVSNDLQQ